MIVVDTSVWIERLIGSQTGERVAALFPSDADCIVPTIVQLELVKWTRREVGAAVSDSVFARTMECIVVDLDSRIAARAADVCFRHRLATADAVVYATALTFGCDLLTTDRHFDGLDRVVYVAKA